MERDRCMLNTLRSQVSWRLSPRDHNAMQMPRRCLLQQRLQKLCCEGQMSLHLAYFPQVLDWRKVMLSLSLRTCIPSSDASSLTHFSVFRGAAHITRGTILRDQIPEADKLRIGIGRSHLSRTELFRGMHGLAVKMTNCIVNLPPCNGCKLYI